MDVARRRGVRRLGWTFGLNDEGYRKKKLKCERAG